MVTVPFARSRMQPFFVPVHDVTLTLLFILTPLGYLTDINWDYVLLWYVACTLPWWSHSPLWLLLWFSTTFQTIGGCGIYHLAPVLFAAASTPESPGCFVLSERLAGLEWITSDVSQSLCLSCFWVVPMRVIR